MAVPSFNSRTRRYAGGGPMPSQSQGSSPASGPSQGGAPAGPAGAPPAQGAAGGQPDPGQQLQAAVQQYAQSKDPQLAVQIADMLVQLTGAGGAAGASAGDPSQGTDPGAGADPAAAGGGPPQMNRKGGKVPPSFGSKGKPAAKPGFEVPGKPSGSPAAGKPAAAAPAQGGKPMDALQKLRAKREAGMKKK